MNKFKGKLALIPGGSSGLGLALGRRLAQFGAHVWILARDPQKLKAAEEVIRASAVEPGQKFGMLQADVCDAQQIQTILGEFQTLVGVPDILINSAGRAIPGCLEDQDIPVFREMMELNFFGTLYATKAVLPGMLARGSGYIVNVSSIAGFVGSYGYSAYGSAKFAVAGFSDAIRSELKPKGIKVSIVYPPTIDSPGLVVENSIKSPEIKFLEGDNVKIVSPEAVAEAILHDVANGRSMILPGFDSKLYFHLKRFAGSLTYPIFDMMVADALKKARKLRESSDQNPNQART